MKIGRINKNLYTKKSDKKKSLREHRGIEDRVELNHDKDGVLIKHPFNLFNDKACTRWPTESIHLGDIMMGAAGGTLAAYYISGTPIGLAAGFVLGGVGGHLFTRWRDKPKEKITLPTIPPPSEKE